MWLKGEEIELETDGHQELIASHDRQLGELTDKMAAQTANIDKLVAMSNRDGVDIAALARIAESRQRRIEDLEGGRE